MRRRIPSRLLLLALAHCATDAYSSFLAPLLPLLVAKLDLSLGQVGALAALSSIASSLSQPLFGWLADRMRRPWFVAFGPLLGALFLSAIGRAPGFATLALLLMLGGLGAAAFHPQAAALASGMTGRRSFGMSVFVTGGTIGFSLGPLYAVGVVGAFGLENSMLAALPGLAVAAILIAWLARVPPRATPAGERPALAELRPHARPLALLYCAVVLRSAVSYGFMTFLSIYLDGHGYSVAAGGAVLTAYLGVGAIGGLLGGWFADRWGGRRVVIVSFLGSAPLFLAFPLVPVAAGLPCIIAGNLLLQSSLPVNVVMGQELSPRHSSTISSLLMGAAWGLGVLLVGPAGALADARGLHTALLALASLLPIGVACAVALPRPHPGAHVTVDLAQPSVATES